MRPLPIPRTVVVTAIAMLVSPLFLHTSDPAHGTNIISQIGDDIDGNAHDFSGANVALSSDGSRIVVGSLQWDSNNPGPGVVRVYDNVNGAWIQKGSDLTGPANLSLFGESVSISASGSRIAVGAPETLVDELTPEGKGFVRVYEWSDDSNSWVRLGSDPNPLSGLSAGDGAGKSVALSADGSVVAFGAPYYDAPGRINVGRVQIWAWNGAAWVSRGEIVGEAAGDSSGHSIALSADGTRLAVGSPHNDSAGSFSGQVEVWDWLSGTIWQQVGSDIEGKQPEDFLGLSVSLDSSGNRLATGGYNNNTGQYQNGGLVRIFDWTGTQWRQTGDDLAGKAIGDEFGESLSLSSDGSILAVGAMSNDDAGDTAGQVSVFRLTSTSWCPIGEAINGEAAGDRFGDSVAISGDGTVFAGGATRNSGGGTNAGHTRVFSITNPPGCAGDTTSSRQKADDSGTPGIFLTLPAPDRRMAVASTIEFGAYAIAPQSPYSLTIRAEGTSSPIRLMTSGRADTGGHFEQKVHLPSLAPGSHTIVFTAQARGGGVLTLGNRIVVDSSGLVVQVTPEAQQPLVR